jgi:hypothetical protein
LDDEDQDEEEEEDIYNPELYDEEDEDIDYSINLEIDFITDAIEFTEEYSLLSTRVAEKLMQLSIAFITQYFPTGDNLRSPLIHFADIMDISNKFGRFNEPYNYTTYIAGLIWMVRLLIMEYALPSREYSTLGWPSHLNYEDKATRLKELHRVYLTQGSCHPINRLLRVLAFGKETVKALGRPCLMMWDPDYQGFKIKEIYLRLDTLKEFVQDGIKSTEEFLQEKLFFGMDLPAIDLKRIEDVIGITKPWYSFLEDSKNQLLERCKFMLDLMKSADSSKHLIDSQGHWDTIKAREYLKSKKKFLRKLMKGMTQSPLISLLLI